VVYLKEQLNESFGIYDYKDKIFVVTGATSGIGKALVFELINREAKVIAVARSAKKFDELILEMKNQNYSIEQLNNLIIYKADLSSMNQVYSVASKIADIYPIIDVLINNVGGYFSDRKTTVDGFELTFGLNYLGHVLFTRVLLDNLYKSPSANIINISSSEHKTGRIHFRNLQLKRGYFGKTAYAQSKLADMIYVKETAEQLGECNIRINAIHPGIVKTNIAQDRLSLQSIIFRLLKHTVAIDVSKAVKRILALLDKPEFHNLTGKYISKEKVVKSHLAVRDKTKRRKLLVITEKLLSPWLKLLSKGKVISISKN
jgi:NAD(P)-dependent dehydrogenase (short-subunit alcohol dehydrogenase family)